MHLGEGSTKGRSPNNLAVHNPTYLCCLKDRRGHCCRPVWPGMQQRQQQNQSLVARAHHCAWQPQCGLPLTHPRTRKAMAECYLSISLHSTDRPVPTIVRSHDLESESRSDQ